MNKVFVRSAYNYDMDVATLETAVHFPEETIAKQSFAEEVDINTIVKRFGLTGQLPSNIRMPSYGDFTQVTDFHDAMDAIVQAQEAFYAMPANVRARFHNSAGEFVDFCSDPDNQAEAEKLGLVDMRIKEAKLAAEAAKAAPAKAPLDEAKPK